MDEAQMVEVARLSTATQALVDTYLARVPQATPEGARAALSLVLAGLQATIRGTADSALAGEPYPGGEPEHIRIARQHSVTEYAGLDDVDISAEEPGHGYWESGDHG